MEFDPAELQARESGRYPFAAPVDLRARIYRGREQLQRWGWAAQRRGAALSAELARRPLATLGVGLGVGLAVGIALGFAAGRLRVRKTRA